MKNEKGAGTGVGEEKRTGTEGEDVPAKMKPEE